MDIMKNLKKNFKIFVMATLTVILLGNCTKDSGDYSAELAPKPFNGNTYQYLKANVGFDSLLLVIDRLNLTDTLIHNSITLFAPTNESFVRVVTKYNVARKLQNRVPLYLKDMDRDFLDSIMCRYIIRGLYPANSFNFINGLTISAVRYGYPMNAKLSTANASGFKSGGPAVIDLSYTRRSSFSIDWSKTTANTVDLRTSNGIRIRTEFVLTA